MKGLVIHKKGLLQKSMNFDSYSHNKDHFIEYFVCGFLCFEIVYFSKNNCEYLYFDEGGRGHWAVNYIATQSFITTLS